MIFGPVNIFYRIQKEFLKAVLILRGRSSNLHSTGWKTGEELPFDVIFFEGVFLTFDGLAILFLGLRLKFHAGFLKT